MDASAAARVKVERLVQICEVAQERSSESQEARADSSRGLSFSRILRGRDH
jgi:hypothetical protein